MASLASVSAFSLILNLFLLISLFHSSFASRIIGRILTQSQDQQNYQQLEYHKGPLLAGPISVNLIWYGNFKASQRAIVADFISSLSSGSPETPPPTVAAWWETTKKYYRLANSKKPSSVSLSLGKQILDENCSLGKSLTQKHIVQLASKGEQRNAINVVLMASDVAVDGFCRSVCGYHGSSQSGMIKRKSYQFAYIWVGNSEIQCPGFCAWLVHQPVYGPQTSPLKAPNNDVGIDEVIISLAGLLVELSRGARGRQRTKMSKILKIGLNIEMGKILKILAFLDKNGAVQTHFGGVSKIGPKWP